jgi:hypothetical protein
MKGASRQHLPPEVLVDLAEGAVVDVAAREHLARCERCSTEVDDLKRTAVLAGRLEVPDPDAQYWEELSSRIGDRLREENQSKPRSRRWYMVAVAAAAAVVAIAATLWSVLDVASPARQPTAAAVQTILPPESEDREFQFLLSVAEVVGYGEGFQEVPGFVAFPVLDSSQLTSEEQELLRRRLERDLEVEENAIS